MSFVCEECRKRERTTGELLKSICQICGREVVAGSTTPQAHLLCDPCAARHNRCKVCGKQLEAALCDDAYEDEDAWNEADVAMLF